MPMIVTYICQAAIEGWRCCSLTGSMENDGFQVIAQTEDEAAVIAAAWHGTFCKAGAVLVDVDVYGAGDRLAYFGVCHECQADVGGDEGYLSLDRALSGLRHDGHRNCLYSEIIAAPVLA